MFEKLKNHLKNFQTDESDSYTRGQVIGLLLLIFMLVLAYYSGRGDGYKSAQAEVPQLKLVSDRIDRIEKAMLDNRACAATIVQTIRSGEVKP